MSTNSSGSLDNICVVCFKSVEIFSIGSCDHIVCYECSTRMRVLCRRNECPICRQDMPKVIFTCRVRPFSEIDHVNFSEEPEFKILFESSTSQNAFLKLLEQRCSVCPNPPTFKTFQSLYDHMRRDHELYYCDLCIDNLKIFTSERRCYTRKELAQHRRKGDSDDRSHRGHPLCEFCDTRYMDNDDLYRHLRRDHLYCHFCDADGHHLYYSSYDYLRNHFRDEHYLCEEGTCMDEKFTPVFRTEIDLRAHKVSAHKRGLGRGAAKQARTLELEFTLKPRARAQDGRDGLRGRGRPRSNYMDGSGSAEEGAVGGVDSPRPSSPQLNPNEFPSLRGATNSGAVTSMLTGGRGLTIHAVGRRTNAGLAVTDENFPALGLGEGVTQATSVRLNINPGKATNTTSSAPVRGVRTGNVSIHVNHRPSGSNNIHITKDDFPALTRNSNTHGPGSSQWGAVSSKKQPAPAPQPTRSQAKQDDFPSLNSQFNANLNLKSLKSEVKPNFVSLRNNPDTKPKPNKTCSVTVPVVDTVPSSSSPKSKTKKKAKGSEDKPDTAKKKSKAVSNSTGGGEEKLDSTKRTKSPSNSGTSSEEKAESIKKSKATSNWGPGSEVKPETSTKSQGDERPETTRNSRSDKPDTAKKKSSQLNIETSALENVQQAEVPPSQKPLPTAEDWFGVSSSKAKNPPPGFGQQNSAPAGNPPPGFPAYGLTFTNSSGQSYAIPNFQYIIPPDFQRRNLDLVTKVNQILLNQVNMEEFRRVSTLYRQDQLSAEEYYGHCVLTMGELGVAQIFPELVTLLPDIRKQQELFQVYQRCTRVKKAKKQRLESCKTCRQVLATTDIKLHETNHANHIDT